MPGASSSTRRVQFVNLNWVVATDPDGAAGRAQVEALLITEDGQRHTVPVAAEDVAAFIALTQASPVLLHDPSNGTLIACNLVGQWLPEDWTAEHRRDH